MVTRFPSSPQESATVVSILAALAACGRSAPQSPADRAARGREIVTRMSDKLGSTPALSVHTDETRERLLAGGRSSRRRWAP